MYRKLHILTLIVLALASCSKEETMRDVAVQFTAAVNSEMTVLVKGGTAQQEPVIADHAVLQAWVGEIKMAEVRQSITPGTTEVSFSEVKLVNGAEYHIYIWVGCEGYYDTADLRRVSVSSEKFFNGNTPQFDAFYSCSTIICKQEEKVQNVDLKRPFAKVSFSAGVPKDAQIGFSAPTTLDLKTGKVSGTRNIQYTIPHGDSSVEAFDYVFADEGVSQMDYTFRLGEDEAKTTAVPISRNKKTNIIYKVNN